MKKTIRFHQMAVQLITNVKKKKKAIAITLSMAQSLLIIFLKVQVHILFVECAHSYIK